MKQLIIKFFFRLFSRIVLAGVAAIALSTGVSAQNDSIVIPHDNPEKLLRKIKLREPESTGINYLDDEFSGHWRGVDFGFNWFLNPDYKGFPEGFMENDFLNSNFGGFNILQKSIGLQRRKNTFGLVTGAGLQLKSYRLDNNITIKRLENGVIEPETLTHERNRKSKLALVSAVVPLLAEVQIPTNHYKNRIYFSGGVFGGVRLGSHTKIKYRVDGKKEKLKVPGHYSIQNFNYGLMARAGYKWVNFFATYDLMPFFKDEKGPVLTPVTVGISIINF